MNIPFMLPGTTTLHLGNGDKSGASALENLQFR
jgi:hypothetical protein